MQEKEQNRTEPKKMGRPKIKEENKKKGYNISFDPELIKIIDIGAKQVKTSRSEQIEIIIIDSMILFSKDKDFNFKSKENKLILSFLERKRSEYYDKLQRTS